MYRARFYTKSLGDPRPVRYPPPGPWWESGFSDTHAIIVAYVERLEQVTEFWPEAERLDVLQENVEIEFSDRFPEPDWWKELRRQRAHEREEARGG